MLAGVILAVVVIALAAYFLVFQSSSNSSDSTLLSDSKVRHSVTISKISSISADTFMYEMKFPSSHAKSRLGISTGSHIRLYGKDSNGVEFFRSYTPISSQDARGSFTLLIKLYIHPTIPEKSGKMSLFLETLKLNDQVQISGPYNSISYRGSGKFYFSEDSEEREYKTVSFIGGGSGITPLYQILQAMKKENFGGNRTLLFGNRTEADILLRKELEALNEEKSARVFYTLDRPADNWKGFSGFVTEDMFKACIPSPKKDHLVILCGPPLMIKDCINILTKMGHEDQNVFSF